MDDHALLREYLEHHSEKAFSELVERYLPLVYGTALRLAGDSHTAQDVAQAVFIQLARKAWTIRNGHALPGWLYRATLHAAYAARRSEIRRRERETAAMNLAEQNNPSSGAISDQIAPLLDEALAGLSRVEQDAVLLRYFQDKSFREVGAALGLNEDAARKRTDRALDKIRLHFSRLGVTTTAALLGSALTTHAATPLPVGFAAKVAGASLSPTVGPGVFAQFITAAFFMSTKKSIVSVAVALLIAAFLFSWRTRVPQASDNSVAAVAAPLPKPLATTWSSPSPAVLAPVLPPVPASQSAPLDATMDPIEAQKAASAAFIKTSRGKAVLNNLRTLATAEHQFMRDTGATSAGYYDVVGSKKDSYISSLSPIMGEDYSNIRVSQGDTQVELVMPDGTIVNWDL